MMKGWLATAPIVVFCLAATPGMARAENLQDAWAIALQVNQQLQSQQALSVSAGYSLAAARSARWPTVRNFTFNAFLSATPAFNTPFSRDIDHGEFGGRRLSTQLSSRDGPPLHLLDPGPGAARPAGFDHLREHSALHGRTAAPQHRCGQRPGGFAANRGVSRGHWTSS